MDSKRCYMPDQKPPKKWRKGDIMGVDMGEHVLSLVVQSVRKDNIPVLRIPTIPPQPWMLEQLRNYKVRVYVPTKAQVEGMQMVKNGKQPSDAIRAELWRADLIRYVPKTFELVLTEPAKIVLKKYLALAKNK